MANEDLVYVPGLWRCAKCKFELVQATLNARDGTVSARDTPGEKCPNCASPLWRVTERDARQEAQRECNAMWEKGYAAALEQAAKIVEEHPWPTQPSQHLFGIERASIAASIREKAQQSNGPTDAPRDGVHNG